MRYVWNRVAKGYNSYLRDTNNRTYWDCEEVHVPFTHIENATLMMILSVDEHPTSGYDYLLLFINDIANRYNLFIQNLRQVSHSSKLEYSETFENNLPSEINPKHFISTGIGGSVVNLFDIKLTSLDSLIRSYWKKDEGKFDVNILTNELEESISIINRPILNITTFLRERFSFRDEAVPCKDVGKVTSFVHKSSEGFYF